MGRGICPDGSPRLKGYENCGARGDVSRQLYAFDLADRNPLILNGGTREEPADRLIKENLIRIHGP